jgi:hypothetical protein
MSSVPLFTIDRSVVSQQVLDEINVNSSYEQADVAWPSVFAVIISHTVMKFSTIEGAALITMTEEDAGFHSTRCYLLALRRLANNYAAVVAAGVALLNPSGGKLLAVGCLSQVKDAKLE